MTPYEPRSIRFLDLWLVDDWRIKLYGIACSRPQPRSELVAAARSLAAQHLRSLPELKPMGRREFPSAEESPTERPEGAAIRNRAAESSINDGPLSANLTPERNEVGSVRLANGDTWRFAFRSHHLLSGPDSFSVFAGPLGTFRVRGDYFCCEVQIPSDAFPKDSAEFLAFLRRVHPSVEPAQ